MDNENLEIGVDKKVTIEDFVRIVYGSGKVFLSKNASEEVSRASRFVSYLSKNEVKVYGITTGFADLRNISIPSDKSSKLSKNILISHDAGIGKPLPYHVTLGALLIRTISLAKGKSGIQLKNLNVLVSMINHRIVPKINETGSLGASGDLCPCARYGRAMMGERVECWINGKDNTDMKTTDVALKFYKIPFAEFGPKEGLAITNGLPFSCSAAIIGYQQLVSFMENSFALLSLTMNAAHVVEDAFCKPIQDSRGQRGQVEVASIIRKLLKDSPYLDRKGVQNDYLFRCIPQIFGYQHELVQHAYGILFSEMNAVTDNPLIFHGKTMKDDIPEHRVFEFEGDDWAVISGGNFHGEYITELCDSLSRSCAKIVLTLERHLTYLMNPHRHRMPFLPTYLIASPKDVGLQSGFMIVQYTANSLAQKICYLGNPMSIFNITSANESEDVVSYSLSAAQKLQKQAKYLDQFSHCYAAAAVQAYSISRRALLEEGKVKEKDLEGLVCEKVFKTVASSMKNIYEFPVEKEIHFEPLYQGLGKILKNGDLRKIVGFPVLNWISK